MKTTAQEVAAILDTMQPAIHDPKILKVISLTATEIREGWNLGEVLRAMQIDGQRVRFISRRSCAVVKG